MCVNVSWDFSWDYNVGIVSNEFDTILQYVKLTVVIKNVELDGFPQGQRYTVCRFFVTYVTIVRVKSAQKRASSTFKKKRTAISELEVIKIVDTRKVDDISMVTVSSKVLAEIIGVGERQIRNLAEEGILVRNSHGKYLLLKSVKNYITNLKIAKAGEKVASDFDGTELDWEQEKARHEHLKSMITEINLQLIKGQVHRSQDVGSVITDMFTKFRSTSFVGIGINSKVRSATERNLSNDASRVGNFLLNIRFISSTFCSQISP